MYYQIVDGHDLARRVNELIAQGWLPQGGLAIGPHGTLSQAMVRLPTIPVRKLAP